MSDSCCDSETDELKVLAQCQAKILWTVLIINLAMFLIEGIFGIIGRSVSLLADSLDMLGDAFVYGISLYVLGKSMRWNASVSWVKGFVMAAFGIGVLVNAVQRYFTTTIPIAETMGILGTLALVANFVCAALLLKHRNDDLNMRSTWLCSRNDVIANLGVLVAAGAVALTGSKYPDLIVGIVIALMVLRSAALVLQESTVTLFKKGYSFNDEQSQ